MKSRKIISSLLALTVATLCAGGTLADEQSEWLKKARLGQWTPKTQDWKAIEAAARKEGEVVIYSVSSRIFKLAKEFKQKYGVKITAYDITSNVQLEKFRREHKAGIYQVDVLYGNETPMIWNEFLPRKLMWNFVPDSIAGFLDADEKQPMLVQRWSSRVLLYNSAIHPEGAPIDNLWDLTRKEWRHKVIFPGPLENAVQANVIQTILQHPKKMAAAHEAEFGKPVAYSKGLLKALKKNPALGKPDAAKEWLYRLLRNKPLLIGSTSKIFKNVAEVKQKAPAIGWLTFSKLRSNKKGALEAAPAINVQPVFGVAYPTVLAVADRAPHPNAAKLLIRYLVEDGFRVWDVIGDYAARSDVAKTQAARFKIPSFEDAKLWRIDQTYVYDTKYSFLSLYLALK